MLLRALGAGRRVVAAVGDPLCGYAPSLSIGRVRLLSEGAGPTSARSASVPSIAKPLPPRESYFAEEAVKKTPDTRGAGNTNGWYRKPEPALPVVEITDTGEVRQTTITNRQMRKELGLTRRFAALIDGSMTNRHPVIDVAGHEGSVIVVSLDETARVIVQVGGWGVGVCVVVLVVVVVVVVLVVEVVAVMVFVVVVVVVVALVCVCGVGVGVGFGGGGGSGGGDGGGGSVGGGSGGGCCGDDGVCVCVCGDGDVVVKWMG
jgi:hypothetical protein